MPLHRDIHWIGRQWAVTGHGVQLIDQKLQGFFDIEASKVWDDALIDAMHAKDWLNVADFEKAIAIARARFLQAASSQPPDPPPSAKPLSAAIAPREVAPPPIEPVAPPPPAATSAPPEVPKPKVPDTVEPPPATVAAPAIATPVAATSTSAPPTLFRMRCQGNARFVRPWRVIGRKI